MRKWILAASVCLPILAFLPIQAATSEVLRVGVEQVTSGYPVPVTFDVDQVIKFEGDRIIEVWASNVRLFKPRFTKGGNLIVLQAVATPEDLKVMPELGRGLGTLTVELASGESAIFNLAYTPRPQSRILTVQRSTRKSGSGDVLPSVLSEAIARNSTLPKPPTFQVSQDGFISPLSVNKPVGTLQAPTRSPSARSSDVSGDEPQQKSTVVGYWLLELGQADPAAWSSGPDAAAYRAFFEILKKGKSDGATFEPTLALAQHLSGVSEQNLVWLVRTLAARSADRTLVAGQTQTPLKTATVDHKAEPPTGVAQTNVGNVTPPATVEQATTSQLLVPSEPPISTDVQAPIAPKPQGVPGSPTAVLQELGIDLADGRTIRADIFLDSQAHVWNEEGGRLRKKLAVFISSLIEGRGGATAKRAAGISERELQRLADLGMLARGSSKAGQRAQKVNLKDNLTTPFRQTGPGGR